MKPRDILIMAVVILMAASVFYVASPELLTWAYAFASVATGILLLCMLQSNMVDSSTEFRWAVVAMAMGCWVAGAAPFFADYRIGPPGMLRALGELAVVGLMRWRQLKAAGFGRACASRATQLG
jgi:hypothetical protein